MDSLRAGMRPIDVRHLGRDRVICCWQVDDVLIDPGPESSLETLIEALGETRPRALLLTHVHLDHAGAAGALVRRWPDLEVHVHEVGAPHLEAPAKLLESARRLYGEDMDRLWGEVVPVPRDNLRVLEGGERVLGFDVAYTPGHASHHVTYLHRESGRAFVGDVAGVRIPPSGVVVAPTPPPDIDLDAWERSLRTLEEAAPTALGLTHFGLVEDAPAQIGAVRAWLREVGPLAREAGEDEFVAEVGRRVRAGSDEATARVFQQAAPAEQLHQGLARYWRKREEAARGAA
jgi:glyoxylase-like metal-dependent hydrolase (beta-lactamase superfamily II)